SKNYKILKICMGRKKTLLPSSTPDTHSPIPSHAPLLEPRHGSDTVAQAAFFTVPFPHKYSVWVVKGECKMQDLSAYFF
uniref:Uncharacterized protein n=1 Tax=Chelonoidis abingdonii TaxID=106734 RepID=A0A8C0J350_CHEAB